ncbi:chemotaxis protein CheR, partial [Bacillus cereus]|nr:chemotaxis protein CheR [Bacillus cereus]
MIIEQDYDHFIASFKQQFNMDIASYKQDRMRRRIGSATQCYYSYFLSILSLPSSLLAF